MELNPKQRDKIAGVFVDIGKITFTAFVIGQFLPNIKFNTFVIVWGFISSLTCWFIGVALLKKE